METTLTHDNVRHESGHLREKNSAPWAAPHDPRTNARPPGNGDVDHRALDHSRERLLAVVGR